MKVDPEDWKYVNADPDPDFDADHNQRVVDDVIENTDRMIREKKSSHKKELEDRSWALSKYLKSLDTGGKESDMGKYFGRRELARLQGEKAMEKIKKDVK